MINCFLYARESTDTEDMQVLSIAAQLSELRSSAKREDLHIKETFIEKQSAKIPCRKRINGLPFVFVKTAALAAAVQNSDKENLSCSVVNLYNEARTYFSKDV